MRPVETVRSLHCSGDRIERSVGGRLRQVVSRARPGKTGRLEAAEVRGIGRGKVGTDPNGSRGDHAVHQRTPAATSEVEQACGDERIGGDERLRFLDHPRGKLDPEPAAKPLIFTRRALECADEETDVEMDQRARPSRRAADTRRSLRAARDHASVLVRLASASAGARPGLRVRPDLSVPPAPPHDAWRAATPPTSRRPGAPRAGRGCARCRDRVVRGTDDGSSHARMVWPTRPAASPPGGGCGAPNLGLLTAP
jgi:hypothetical protein